MTSYVFIDSYGKVISIEDFQHTWNVEKQCQTYANEHRVSVGCYPLFTIAHPEENTMKSEIHLPKEYHFTGDEPQAAIEVPPDPQQDIKNEDIYAQFMNLLAAMRLYKPAGRGDKSRYWAIAITELEKAFAVFMQFAR